MRARRTPARVIDRFEPPVDPPWVSVRHMTDDHRPRAPALRVPANVRFGDSATPDPGPFEPPPGRAATVPARAVAAQQRAAASIRVHEGRPDLGSVAERQADAPPVDPRPPLPPSFVPNQPRSWDELDVDPQVIVGLVLRQMLGNASVSGKQLARDLALPLAIVRDVMDHLKSESLVTHRSTTALGDFVSELTQAGHARAIGTRDVTSYVGPAPVSWAHYLTSLKMQALSLWSPGERDLREAFSDLDIGEDLLDRLGPALTSCRPAFLFGEPGNGKTSIAQRVTRCFGPSIWIPRVLVVGGHLVKLFDPAIHRELHDDPRVLTDARIDTRWVRIERPTVVAGGELTLDQLEIAEDPVGKVHEAPLQLKANCGTFVIDDFGRGKVPPKDLLNRWIVPLETHVDFLRLPDGRKFPVPFACMLVFSTNLEPRDLADEAFLRRIPYKVHIGDPDETEFAALVERLAATMGVRLSHGSVKYLIERHYRMPKRPMRFCHPRDLLLQVVHLCAYQGRTPVAGPPEWDRVVSNYFGMA